MDGVGAALVVDERADGHVDVRLDHLEDHAAPAAERVAVDQRGLDVGEAAHGVEVVALVVVERCLVAEPPERRVRVETQVDVVWVVVDVLAHRH